MLRILPCLLAALPVGQVVAQADTISERRVRDTVTWLAADERKGRDTGSPELEQAAQWLAERFEQAGLRQLREGSWFHEFTLPGMRLDSTAVELTLTRALGDQVEKFKLVADQDVRQWQAADGLSGEEQCTVALADDPVLQRLLTARSARRPIVIEVDETHPYWQQAAGMHAVVAARRQAARPILLVKKGLLPAAPQDGREAIWTASWKVAAPERTEVAQRNVVAWLPAREDSDKKGEYVVVSAHYDHVGTGRAVDGDAIYNGADDDATGTTAVVLIAEAMAKAEAPRRNVLFVCFAAEERGLLGSRAFCDRPPLQIEQVVANLNIEMIGRPEEGNEGKAWITGEELSDFASICGSALERSGIGLVEFQMASRLFAASDNFSFVQKGIVAHSVSAGSLHEDYHRPGDEVDKLDIPHMTRIVRGLYDVTVELANRDAAPKWNEQGEERLKKMRR